MLRVAEFEKVSFKQFKTAWENIFADHLEEIREIYDSIKYPTRASVGSAGYDFFTPIAVSLNQGEQILIPTGIRVKIENGWFLGMMPRSGLGFKYRLQLDNTVGIIDSDYYYSDNEGIFLLSSQTIAKPKRNWNLKPVTLFVREYSCLSVLR